MKLSVCADKHQSFLQGKHTKFFMGLARHASNTPNNKYTISLQYLKKEVSDVVDFLHRAKHESSP